MSTQPKDKVSSSTNDAQIIRILAVKASEENSKQLLSAMVVSNANISAISAKSDMGFIAKRADYLFKLLPAPIRLLENVTRFPGNWIKLTVLISFVIGLLSNYLGPSKLIHAVYNPLTILLLWSLLIYLLMVLKRFWKIRLPETKLKMRQILPSEKQAEDDKLKKKESIF